MTRRHLRLAVTQDGALKNGLVCMLLGALLSLVPAAFATPPDETWHGGWYDDADHDDVIMLATSATSVSNTDPGRPVHPSVVVVGHAGDLDVFCPGHSSPTLLESRAPPAL
jgi:hypothetical protein